MTKLDPSEGHLHPGLDVSGEEEQGLVLDEVLEIGLTPFENEIDVGFGGVDGEQLWRRESEVGERGRGEGEGRDARRDERGGRKERSSSPRRRFHV